MAEAIAVLRRAGRRRSSIPRTFRAWSIRDPANNFLPWGTCSGADEGRGADDGLLGRAQVRHEARLQHVARVARAAAPVKIADRAERVERRRTRTPARSSTARRLSTSPTRWIVERDRARYEADRAKDIRLAATHGIDEVMKARAARCAAVSRRRAAPRIAAKAGYPTVIVPFGLVPNAPAAPFPAGLRREAAALRRQLHRHGVQRAAAARSSPTRSSRRRSGESPRFRDRAAIARRS